jgi:hypothetical protein
MDFKTVDKLKNLSFSERQFLTVSATESDFENEENADSSKDENNQGLFDKIVDVVGFLRGGWEVSVGKVIGAASAEAYKSLKRAWDKGLPIQRISFGMSQEFQFPPGHPRIDVVYACHPASPTTYYPLADFHRVAFEDKFAEAMTLLMSLGANSLHVEHVAGWSSEFAANLAVPLGAVKPPISADIRQTHDKANHLLFQATLDGNHIPTLPDKMVWYNHESTWKSIADGRLKYGLDAFRLNVTYRDDYGVDSKLAASIQSAGLGIGGKFEAHQSTIWQIYGTFKK